MNQKSLILFVVLVVAGCSAPPAKPAVPAEPKAPNAQAQAPAPAAKPIAPPAEPATAQLSEAARYYGVEAKGPIDFELTDSTRKGIQTGSQTMAFKEMVGGNPVYEMKRTGGLSVIGDQTVIVDKAGVRTLASSLGTLKGDSIELPANIKPGVTWHAKTTLTTPAGQDLTNDNEFSAVGMTDIKTKGGK